MDLVDPVDVHSKPRLVTRLTSVLVYFAAAGGVSWRAWSYQLTPYAEPYPVAAVVMCACLVAVLYTLIIMTLAGRSELLAAQVVVDDGHGRDGPNRRGAASPGA